MAEKTGGLIGGSPTTTSQAVFGKHYTLGELAEMWRFDRETLRRWFMDEPGVLKHGRSRRRDGKRDYVSLRIPEALALRVYRQRTA